MNRSILQDARMHGGAWSRIEAAWLASKRALAEGRAARGRIAPEQAVERLGFGPIGKVMTIPMGP